MSSVLPVWGVLLVPLVWGVLLVPLVWGVSLARALEAVFRLRMTEARRIPQSRRLAAAYDCQRASQVVDLD